MRKYIAGNNLPIIILVLTAFSAFVYLPWVGQIGYMNDDWYLMYSVGAYGPRAFIDIFSVDRPARALVMMPAYALFGENPLYYNLSAYAFRLISGLAFLWLLRMLFPRRDGATLLASLLFLVYPGFLSQVNGLDYQSHLVGLAAAHLSIALTVKAVLTERPAVKFGLHMLSVLLGLLYLSQMEWYIGFEVFRWGCVFLLSARDGGMLVQKILRTVRWAHLSLAVPGIFLVWRLFFFQNERGATDVGLQLANFSESPVLMIFWWGVGLVGDAIDVLWLAWGVPFSNLLPVLRPRHIMLGSAIAIFMTYAVYKLTDLRPDTQDDEGKTARHKEMVFLGAGLMAAGLIPVILVNREVDFVNFSRYSLVSAAGASLLMGAFLFHFIKSKPLRWALIAILLNMSVLTHHANSVQASAQTRALNEFWWQVSWRVPQIEKGTTLIGNYPAGGIQEDYFVWGPANLIYYPEKLDDKGRIHPPVFAAVLNAQTTNKILVRSGEEYDNRKNIITYADYGNILILSRPSNVSCVQLIDGAQPELSAFERNSVMLVAPFSETGNVILDAEFHTPPQVVFGEEPPHEWCYYYQNASLARQRGEWNEVVRLGNEALEKSFLPQDHIEWMPFLQAYARDGNIDRLIEIKRHMRKADPFVFLQVCQSLTSMQGLDEETVGVINAYYCAE